MAGAIGIVAGKAGAFQVNDSDRVINDPPNRGRGQTSQITDTDPSDAVGNGSGSTMRQRTGTPPERAPAQPYTDPNVRAAPTGVTDSDPTDPSNYGRGTAPRGAPRSPYAEPIDRSAGSGITDSDPTDPVGMGTGRNRQSCTDSDSGASADPARQGRRC